MSRPSARSESPPITATAVLWPVVASAASPVVAASATVPEVAVTVVVVGHGAVVEVDGVDVEVVDVVEVDVVDVDVVEVDVVVDVVDVDVVEVVVVGSGQTTVVEVVPLDDATVTAELVPVIEDDVVSVAVMVWLPVVLKVALNVPVPLVRLEELGRLAAESEDVKEIWSANDVTTAPFAFCALTVKANDDPAVACVGMPLNTKCVALVPAVVVVVLATVVEVDDVEVVLVEVVVVVVVGSSAPALGALTPVIAEGTPRRTAPATSIMNPLAYMPRDQRVRPRRGGRLGT
jgi:hypothetical protein